jgi:4-hydroxy 2-oxovalerate aldolase
MKHIKVLDCTLRDGGYVVNHIFGDKTIKGIIKKLCKAKVDVIECGFLKDVEYKPGSTTFKKVEEIRKYIPKEKNGTSFVAMIDYGRYSIDNLSDYDGTSVDALRDCFFKKDRYNALEFSKELMAKGYKVYIQPVDILGYSDSELLELIENINEIKPYAFSIVDTFGSLYVEDLIRIFGIVNHNLDKDIVLGFHSHNNLQLSFALAQKFAEISLGQRNVCIDTTVCGMGRGAGNTNTELVLDYLNKKFGYDYDINELLDLIDVYMSRIMSQYQWGYSIPNFIAGIYSSHVHNINYLLERHNISTKDMRLIIESIDKKTRKRYDYDNLERLYTDYFSKEVDDENVLLKLKRNLKGKKILLIAPGKSMEIYKDEILKTIKKDSPIVICVNFIDPYIPADFAFYSNFRRYENSQYFNEQQLKATTHIITSNVMAHGEENQWIINYNLLIKRGWRFFDNSMILLLRLLAKLSVKDILIAGFDGFDNFYNYSDSNEELETYDNKEKYKLLNKEIKEMLIDYRDTMAQNIDLKFITPSIFSDIFIGTPLLKILI